MKRSSLLCPNCRKLVGREVEACPYCGLKRPGSLLNDYVLTQGLKGEMGIIKLIILANVVMFIVSILIDFHQVSFSSSPFSMLSPSGRSLEILGSSGAIPVFILNKWWTLISASFLHGGLLHILFNMVALYQLGPLIIKEYGSSRMIIIYTMSGIGGYLISSLFGVVFTIGASASVCGLIGAALFYGKNRGGTYGQAIYSQIGGWALTIFLFGFLVPGINNWGHGGGMAVGALVGLLLGYSEKKKENMLHKYLSMGCIIGTAVILLWSLTSTGMLLFF